MGADGTVSKDELEQAVSADTSHLPALMEEAGLDPNANVIEQMDKDKDGHVTWSEFKSDLQVPKEETTSTEDKKLKFQVFDRIDADADGPVSKDELEQAVSADTSHLPALMEEAGLDPTANVIEQMDK